MNDNSLNALLAEVQAPSMPAGLADRIAAAAMAVPQEARAAQARRAVGRDRRGAWLRRPLIGGAIALGLAFSGAVAATLAGVPLPAKVEAVIAQLPFVGQKAVEVERPPVRHAAAHPAPRPAPVEMAASVDEPALQPESELRPRALRRMILAREIVAQRRAAGLPTPSVQRVQRMILHRQMQRRWREATPEQRAAFIENHPRFGAMIEARRARREGFTPDGRDAGMLPREANITRTSDSVPPSQEFVRRRAEDGVVVPGPTTRNVDDQRERLDQGARASAEVPGVNAPRTPDGFVRRQVLRNNGDLIGGRRVMVPRRPMGGVVRRPVIFRRR